MRRRQGRIVQQQLKPYQACPQLACGSHVRRWPVCSMHQHLIGHAVIRPTPFATKRTTNSLLTRDASLAAVSDASSRLRSSTDCCNACSASFSSVMSVATRTAPAMVEVPSVAISVSGVNWLVCMVNSNRQPRATRRTDMPNALPRRSSRISCLK